MKKFPLLTFTGIVLAVACVILIILDHRSIAAGVGLMAYFTALGGAKKETTNWQIITHVIIAAVFGYAMCPSGGLLCMAACTTLLALIGATRLLFFEQIGHSKAKWLEPTLFAGALAYYVFGNIYDGSGWVSWSFSAPPMLMGAFMVLGNIADGADIAKRKGAKFKVEIGKPAPDFSLQDQDGNMVTLSEYKGKRHVLLIFVRGDWCPTCHIMLRTYEKNKEKFAEKNVMLMAVGPDPVGVNRDMVLRLGLEYKTLSDDKHLAAKAYGMQIQNNNPMTKYEEGIPLPASFLVHIEGRIQYTSNPERPGEILNPDTIFPVLAGLN
jgi:peroxiredoxin Q/BCP